MLCSAPGTHVHKTVTVVLLLGTVVPGAGGRGRQNGYLTVSGPERTGTPQAVRDGFLGEVCGCGTGGPPEKWDPQGGRGRSKKEGWRRGGRDGHQLVSPDQEVDFVLGPQESGAKQGFQWKWDENRLYWGTSLRMQCG